MMNQMKCLMAGGARRWRWPLRCGLLGLALARVALAADPLYQIDYPVVFTVPPNVHATNFVNNATPFEVELPLASSGSTLTLFETWDTLNYTNNGSMISSTGFNFDTQVTNAFGSTVHLTAANFFNPGTISCGTELIVNATNIAMPGGTVAVGSTTTVLVSGSGGTIQTVSTSAGGSGLISFVGQNVDLSSSTLTLGSGSGGMGSVAAIPNSGSIYYAGFGQDTNVDWDPSISLTVASASPSLVRMGNVSPADWEYPFGDGAPFPTASALPLPTTPYQIETDLRTNSFIYDYVFVANSDPSVTFNVYQTPNAGNKAGSDIATVEFVGSYLDPATGLPANNYLYVTDDYLQGVANNLRLTTATGIPNNFTFTVSAAPMLPSGTIATPNVAFHPFPAGAITNNYSYADVQCVPTSIVTNSVTLNTNNYLAVMPGKILISASSNLDLTFAQISGANYLSVTASNRMVGSANAAIIAPYSSFNVGFTNGNLVATNLLEPTVPAWNGYAQAWSTRFIIMTTNSIINFNPTNGLPVSTNSYAVTNDFRVVIIANQATPTSPAQVWDLSLHGSNNIVICDVYNILDNLSLDCVGLTLTTNGPSAQSPMGVLNLQGTLESWTAATPNLRYLTNYGDIYLPLTGVNSLGFFGTPAKPYGALLNYGLIEDEGSQIWADNFLNSGIFYNGVGSFTLHSQTATLTGANAGGYILAGADVSITTGSLMVSNLFLEADRSLTITATDQFTDTGVTSGSIWYVGLSSVGNGIKVLGAPPATGGANYGNSLLGTTIELFAPANRTIANVWAGADYGPTPAGFTNNLAVGMLVLDSLGSINNTRFTFSGAGVSNALYVDYLYFLDQATNRDSLGNPAALNINSNLVIYYAQAVMDGVSVARKMDGKNNGHLRWVPAYTGFYSSTNIIYKGVSYAFNAALAQDPQVDSNGNGIPNSVDPMPFFVSGMVNLTDYATNNPPNSLALTWNTIPLATNFVFYSTNNAGPFNQQLTNFISPLPYPGPATNVTVFDTMVTPPRYYRVMVYPWLTYPF